MGSILGYAKGEAPFLRHFKRLNENIRANHRIQSWMDDLRVQRIVRSMPWWRKTLFRLGEWLGKEDVEHGQYGLLIRPAVNWIERFRP